MPVISDGNVADDALVVARPIGPRAEAINALRTHVVAQHLNKGRRALAVCAASADVGCTFVAVNLAVSLSQIGLNTLLIDGDMRRPGVQQLIPIPLTGAGVGLAECLAGEEDGFARYVQTGAYEHLSVMYAGDPPANPQELIGGERFRALIESCLRDYDITVIDTPPANSYADARRISSVVAYSLVVARRNVSLVEDVKTLVGELEIDHAQVIGTVLNEG